MQTSDLSYLFQKNPTQTSEILKSKNEAFKTFIAKGILAKLVQLAKHVHCSCKVLAV
jgi:hypothetical protein